MRMFIAIELTDKLREGCEGLIRVLEATGAELNAVSVESLHITVKFLGDVREDDVKELKDAMSSCASHAKPFRLGFSVLGYFGSVRFPRTIWVGISDGQAALTALMRDAEESTSFIRKEERKHSPHLTLARVRGVRNASELVHAITENRDVKLSELDVKELVLVRSTLTPKGPVYETADSFELKGT